ncbi:hypothetical protein HWV62_9377 [Athelia sp. TMB]|nr:hypothetical protein HWV62_9377 [Athelia sp. TMB]
MVVLREILERISIPSGLNPLDAPEAPASLAQCYTIPYGGFGFISHVLTLYTMYCNASRRRWYAPWMEPKPPKKPGLLERTTPSICKWLYRIIALWAKIAITFALSIYTIYRCHGAYRLLAVWKMMLSCFDGASEGLFEYHKPGKMGTFDKAFFVFQWILLFLPGVGAGIAGIYKLAREYWDESHTLHTVTWVFVGVFSAMVFVTSVAVTIYTLKPRTAKAEVPQEKRNSSSSTHSDEKRTSAADPQAAESQAAGAPPTAVQQEVEALKEDDANPGRLAAVLGLAGGWESLENKAGLNDPGFFKHFVKITVLVLGISLIIAYVLGTAYADWMIGIAAGNVVGVPHERVLGGIYFAAKHLSMLLF